jgi:hypothetical protein
VRIPPARAHLLSWFPPLSLVSYSPISCATGCSVFVLFCKNTQPFTHQPQQPILHPYNGQLVGPSESPVLDTPPRQPTQSISLVCLPYRISTNVTPSSSFGFFLQHVSFNTALVGIQHLHLASAWLSVLVHVNKRVITATAFSLCFPACPHNAYGCFLGCLEKCAESPTECQTHRAKKCTQTPSKVRSC